MGDRAVVEEHGERSALAHVAAIDATRIERDGSRTPVPAGLAHARGLAGRQDGEPHALLGEHGERVLVHGRLGEPHPGGLAPEPVTEVGQPPSHLGDLVAAARERQDRVTVGLRDGVAASARHPARPVRRQDRGIDVGALRLEPRHERGAHVEGEGRKVVDDVRDPVARVHAARGRVRRVALRGDARVPVVVGGGGVLGLDALEPGTLAGRLVEVAVDRDEAGMAHGSGKRLALVRGHASLRLARWLARGPVRPRAGARADPAGVVESEGAGPTSVGAGPTLRGRRRRPCLARRGHRRRPPLPAGWRAPP